MPSSDDASDPSNHTPTPASMTTEDYLEEGSGDVTRNAKNSFSDSAHSKVDGGAKALRAKQKAMLPKSVLDD